MVEEMDRRCCSPILNCFSRWKLWIRPAVMSLYFAILVIVLPILIISLWRSLHDLKIESFIVGGLFSLMALPISLWDITQHLVHYTKPYLQKYIIRILWMVPIYSLNAWLGLYYPEYGVYMDSCRECYEAYVIYNFMMFLLTYLSHEVGLEEGEVLSTRSHIKHIFPLCCLKPWPIGSKLVHRCKHGILQYTFVRPLTTVISVICELAGVYREGEFRGDAAYPYMIAANNLSQFVAMYCLVFFYRAHREALNPMKPIGKFLCIKAVVFFSFFQGVIIAILVFTGVLSSWFGEGNYVPQRIQNFLICIEMFLAAIAHHYTFSYKPYVDITEEQQGCCFAFLHMWDISDVRRDFAEHINVIGATVRRRVGGNNQYDKVGGKNEEKTSLLHPIASENNPVHASSGGAYQALSDGEHEGIYAAISALKRSQSAEQRTILVDVEEHPPPISEDVKSETQRLV